MDDLLNKYCLAVSAGDMTEIDRLVDLGVNVNSFKPSGYPIIWLTNATSDLRHLIKLGGNVNILHERHGDSWLHNAYDVAEVTMLLECGANPNIRALNDSSTPLFSFVSSQSTTIAKLLLDNGANPSIQRDNGWSCVHSAVIGQNLPMIRLLLDSGIDTELIDDERDSALMFAAMICRRDNLQIFQLLVESGADVNKTQRRDLYTAAHIAAYHDDSVLIRYINEIGGNLELRNCNGQTPFDLAVATESYKAAKTLQTLLQCK